MPVSDPANKNLSEVTVYLKGRNPFLSWAAMIHFPSVAEIAAGPSHGSIVLFKKLNSCWWAFETVFLLLDQASGISISFTSGTDFPDLTSNSNTLSKAAESEFPVPITGFRDSISSKNLLLISCSWIFIQFIFPLIVLISPLWANVLKGWAKSQLGKVFVEYLWWKIANLEINLLSIKSG